MAWASPPTPPPPLPRLPHLQSLAQGAGNGTRPFYLTPEAPQYAALATYYNLPYASLRNALWDPSATGADGTATLTGVSATDGATPLDAGHSSMADMLVFKTQQAAQVGGPLGGGDAERQRVDGMPEQRGAMGCQHSGREGLGLGFPNPPAHPATHPPTHPAAQPPKAAVIFLSAIVLQQDLALIPYGEYDSDALRDDVPRAMYGGECAQLPGCLAAWLHLLWGVAPAACASASPMGSHMTPGLAVGCHRAHGTGPP
jgi:hypothetical protein